MARAHPFCLCLLIWFIVYSSGEELDALLKRVCGAQFGRSRNISTLNNAVVVTAANYGYMNHVRNFKCFTDRLGLQVLFFALDARVHDLVSRTMNDSFHSYLLMPPSTVPATRIHGSDVEETLQIRAAKQSSLLIEEGSAMYHTHQFHVITTRKLEAVSMVLQSGYDVLFIDTDVVLLQDPFPYILYKNVDYIFSINKPCPWTRGLDFFNPQDEGNSGLVYFRATPLIRALLQTVIEAAPTYPGLDDQSIFWRVLRQFAAANENSIVALPRCRDFNYSGPIQARRAGTDKTDIIKFVNSTANNRRIVLCPLDECAFAVGAFRGTAFAVLQRELARRNMQAVALHCNWLKGNAAKQQALEKHGYWLAGVEGSGTCKPLRT